MVSTAVAPAESLAVQAEPKKRAVTIKDIAKIAGVHFTTVSLALRDHPSLLPATKARIREVADKMGYVPNAVFSALTHFHLNGRVRAATQRVAYLINHPLDQGAALYRPQQQILEGAPEQARALGYELEVVTVGVEGNESLRLDAFLKEQNITGVVLAAFDPGFAPVTLDWDEYSIVKIDSLHMDPPAPVVGSDHRQDVRLAFQRLRTLGYRRIGLAIGRADEDATERLYTAGYLLEQAAIAAEERVPELLFPYNCSMAQASELLCNWIRAHRVDAVLCNWSVIGDMLRSAGLLVPQEVACASLCLLDRHAGLAGVCPNPGVVGAKAVSIVAALLKSGERGVPQFASRTFVKSFWTDGASAPAKTTQP